MMSETHPPRAGLDVLRDRGRVPAAWVDRTVVRPGVGGPGPPGPTRPFFCGLARALVWPWLPWAKDSQSRRPVGAGAGGPPVGRYDQRTMGTRVLVIDNYDSFVYNLVQELGELGADPVVHRNDAIDIDGIRAAVPRRHPHLPRARADPRAPASPWR